MLSVFKWSGSKRSQVEDIENILNGKYDNVDEIKFRYIGKCNFDGNK